MKKYFLSLIIFSILFLPMIARAQTDQRCWLKSGCEETGGTFYEASKHDEAAAACGLKNASGEEFGFCLPVASIDTEVSFGGRRTFKNFGVFIDFIYKYAVGVASILAVVMIIISGAQWAMSGGNKERIGSAKKRIGGAIIGLVLALLSYTVLNNINPYLVNLRLPQVWMINKQGISPPTCDKLEDEKIAPAAKPGKVVDKKFAENAKFVSQDELTALCGHQYFVEGTGGQTCMGTSCPSSPSVCYKSTATGDKVQTCHAGSIAGYIKASDLFDYAAEQSGIIYAAKAIFGEGWSWEWADTPKIAVFCKDGENDYITGPGRPNGDGASETAFFDKKNLAVEFIVGAPADPLQEGANKECGTKENIKGFALYLEFDEAGEGEDDEHFIGIDKETGEGVDIGEDLTTGSIYEQSLFKYDGINKYLFSEEDLKKGVYMDIDASKVCDIDTGEQFHKRTKECYGPLGWKLSI